jgi:hypothetical protein
LVATTSQPANGSVSCTEINCTYNPNPDFYGTDTFTFSVSNGSSISNTSTATVNVAAVNDAPSFTKGADQSVAENAPSQSAPAWATGITAGPANESEQTLTFETSNDNNALFSIQPSIDVNGTLTYTPAANKIGTAVVTVRLRDDGGIDNSGVDTSAEQTFNITLVDNIAPVTGASTSPVANAAGWNNSNVDVALAATDNTGGSGVQDITYNTSGAQVTPPTTVGGGSAVVSITAEGETVVTVLLARQCGECRDCENVDGSQSTRPLRRLRSRRPQMAVVIY